MTPAITRALGGLVLAHGISHAVLSVQRGVAASVWTDGIPAALYAIAMIGFLIAGLGLVGVRRLNPTVDPLLVLASGFSMVAITQFGDPALWFGGFCDVGLFALGVWRGYSG